MSYKNKYYSQDNVEEAINSTEPEIEEEVAIEETEAELSDEIETEENSTEPERVFEEVLVAPDEEFKENHSDHFGNFDVKVLPKLLTVRPEADRNSGIIRYLKAGDVVTVVSQSGLFGKLSTGGWIEMKYAEEA